MTTHTTPHQENVMGYPHFSTDCNGHWNTTVICGSMRFFPQMLKVATDLTLDGRIVLMPFCVVAPDEQDAEYKAKLDRLHRRKIDLARDVVVVTDESGYYGNSTASEIKYANETRKPVQFTAIPGDAT